MRRRLAPAYITLFKLAFLAAAVFTLCGFTVSRECRAIKAKTLAKISLPDWYHEGLYFDGRYIWVNNGKKGNTWVVDPDAGAVVKEIKPIGTFTEAVTALDKDTFFVTDWDANKVYTAHIENDAMIPDSEKSVAPAFPAGAVWDGSNLFVITWTRSITGTKYHLLKMDAKLNLLSRAAIKKIEEPAHMAWDSKNLWITSWYSKKVYKIDPVKMEILGHFKSPAVRTTGIAWDGAYFWITGTYSGLYKVELQ